MPLSYSLVYQSVATPLLTPAALLDILLTARRFNSSARLTGLLLVDGGRVLQFLEGREPAITDLYARLVRDPRHTAVTLLAAGPAQVREFPDWAMGFMPIGRTPLLTPGRLNVTRPDFLLGRAHNLSAATTARINAWRAGGSGATVL